MAVIKRKLPIPRDFVFRHDADFRFIYRVKNPDGTAMNNTGWQVDMDIRLVPNGTLISRFSTVTGEIVVSGATGYVTFDVPSIDIALLPAGLFFCDIRETYPDTTIAYRFTGSVNIVEMVTHE